MAVMAMDIGGNYAVFGFIFGAIFRAKFNHFTGVFDDAVLGHGG